MESTLDRDEKAHRCPICKVALQASPRYPNYICGTCASAASSPDSRPLTFGNTHIGGGYVARYGDTKEIYDSHACWIKGVECHAGEARFGGIVIETVEPDYLQYYDLEAYLFDRVGPVFRSTGHLSPLDLYLFLIWKANRSKNITKSRLARIAGDYKVACRRISRELHSAASDKERLRVLMIDWGFLLPTATALLTILYPNIFTVYDVRVCNSLGAFQKLANRSFSDKLWADYIAYKHSVLQHAPQGLTLRQADQFLWAKSFYTDAKEACAPNNSFKPKPLRGSA